ncbi:MAG: sulfatase-like hydrolase/transferase [Sedimentisphaerales bacterium]|nr:sulfatase-like hydrolase/transferase [Sedimentisphaerales bacterium]
MRSKSMWQFPSYPLMLAMAAILNLYTRFMYSYDLSYLILPLVITMFAISIFWLICGCLSSERHMRGLLTLFLVVAILAYGNLHSLAGKYAAIVTWSYLPISALIIWRLKKIRHVSVKLTILLNAIAASLLASGIISIISFNLMEYRLLAGSNEPLSNEMELEPLIVSDNMPDIYHIILDEYAITEVLQGQAKVDNTDFLNKLRELGFTIAANSRSNYGGTPFCLTSLLNFNYLSKTELQSYHKLKTEKVLHRILDNNNTFRSLRQAGYTIITTETFVRQGTVRGADISLGRSVANRFYSNILSNTPFRHLDNGDKNIIPYQILRYGLEVLPELAKGENSPFYVFSHICCPHSPVQIDENYQFCSPQELCTEANADTFRNDYRKQVIGLNKLVMETVEKILKNSKRPPIIIIQGDHGIRARILLPGTPMTELQTYGNLNAMFLPGQNTSLVSNDFSPVNTYRLLFNLYFGTNYPLLDNLCSNSREKTDRYENQLNALRNQLNSSENRLPEASGN